jgi:hypothetical protein
MLKCLHCEDRDLHGYLTKKDDSIFIHQSFICSNGHSTNVRKKADGSYILCEREWYPGIPGSLSHLRIYDFKYKSWCIWNIYSNRYATDMFEEYLNQQNQLKSETSASRLEWLKCAKRLNICKDVRLLIGMYIKPSEFWKIEKSWWCVV